MSNVGEFLVGQEKEKVMVFAGFPIFCFFHLNAYPTLFLCCGSRAKRKRNIEAGCVPIYEGDRVECMKSGGPGRPQGMGSVSQ